jgi:hypothetical protein
MQSFLQEDGEMPDNLLLCIASNADFSRMCKYMPQAPPTQLSLAMHRAQAVLDANWAASTAAWRDFANLRRLMRASLKSNTAANTRTTGFCKPR